jgi:5'-phosphate synthase pdxT subunit
VIERVGPEVEVLASVADRPVLVRQDRILGCAFHPELTEDTRVHEWLVQMARESKVPCTEGDLPKQGFGG